jgi:23S rRNA (uracil1939-C5)-methyltransferase
VTEVTITALGRRGEGIAEIDGRRVFVPFTLPGERVGIDVDGERGTLREVLQPSSDRALPFSAYFGACGGCTLQHLSPAAYAAFKRGLVVDALARAGLDAPVAELVLAHGAGRRRATMHARRHGAGYMRLRSHEVLAIDHCAILVPALREAAPRLAQLIHAVTGDCDVAFTATDTGLDIAVRTEKRLQPQRLVPLGQQLQPARLSLNGELVLQARPPAVRMGKATVELPIGGFLQATAAAEDALAALVLAGVGKAKSVADLFSGVGPFALRLAGTARVLAVDSSGPAIAALRQAVRHTQGLKPVTALRRDLFRDPLAPAELTSYDAIVFDPPRAGAEAQARELARSKVRTLVGVSCDPVSFARDAAILAAGGYRLESVTPLDQFAWSAHVELVGVFRR